MAGCACTIVIATHNRCARLLDTLTRLSALPERPGVIVVDNRSDDETCGRVQTLFPAVQLVRLGSNTGAVARNIGASLVQTSYIAFCDDDCWWEPGSLARATTLLDAYADVGLLHARVMVDGERLDDACMLMEASPIPKRTACPGHAIAAFMACAVVIRRSAFLATGGYHPRYHLGAEESLLALELLERGWQLIYDPQLTLVHAPAAAGRTPRRRRVTVRRNRLWTAWLRHSSSGARHATAALLREAVGDMEALDAFVRALAGLPWILRERRPVSEGVERLVDALVQLPA